MPNEAVGTRFDHGLLGCDCHRGREGGAEHVDGVETERDPRVDQQHAQPEEENARTRDGGGRNFQSQQHAEGVAEQDHPMEDHARSFILAQNVGTEAFALPDPHAHFHYGPDEITDYQGTQKQRIMSEKRLHVPRPFFSCVSFPWSSTQVNRLAESASWGPNPAWPQS